MRLLEDVYIAYNESSISNENFNGANVTTLVSFIIIDSGNEQTSYSAM